MSFAPGSGSSPPPPARLDFIDGLRGMAMLMVLLYHCWLFGGQWRVELSCGARTLNLASAISFGHVGVNLFLVLSGFCLYWPFVKGGDRREPTLWEFARRRCRRILPPYYAALVLTAGTSLIQASYTHGNSDLRYTLNWLLLHALMLHNTRPEYVLSMNGSLWSLALESQLYVLFPVLVEAYRRFNLRGVLLVVLLASSAYRFFLIRGHYLISDEYAYVLAYNIFGRCFEFALGMWAASVVAHWHRGQKSLFSWTDFLPAALIVSAALIAGNSGHFQMLTDAMWGVLFVVLLLAGSRPGSLAQRALSSRPLVRLGLFSYSVYLVHLPLVILLGRYARAHFTNAGDVLFQLLLVIPSMLALGYLFHLLFEKPFIGRPRVEAPPLLVEGLSLVPGPGRLN